MAYIIYGIYSIIVTGTLDPDTDCVVQEAHHLKLLKATDIMAGILNISILH